MRDDRHELARTAGLRELDTPQLSDVDRRRSQLWLLSLVVGLTVPVAIILLGEYWLPAPIAELLDLHTIRMVLLALVVSVFGYVAERERALRRLTGMLVEERVLTASLISRVHEIDLLFAATRALNSSLELPTVLQVILTSAYDLLQAREGSIQLVCADEPEQLEVAAVRGPTTAPVGERQRISTGLAGTVAYQREALLISGNHPASRSGRPIKSAMVVPLEVRGELVGVLNLAAGHDRDEFNEFDLRSVAVFAETAAAAISNARAYLASQEAVESLTEFDRMKDEFLSMVTHELRTPLTAMIGVASIIANEAGRLRSDQVRELAEMAGDQGWRLDRLVQNLVQTSRIAEQGLPVDGRDVDVRQPVEQTVVALRKGAADHSITVSLPDEPLVRHVDADAICQIVANLVSNATRYTPAGSSITVTVGPWAGGITLAVSDDGPGIPPEDRQRIFEKFQRGARADDAKGLGLGLFLVRSLAEAHGGHVDLESRPGRGCRFTVVLDALPRGDEAPEPATAVTAGS